MNKSTASTKWRRRGFIAGVAIAAVGAGWMLLAAQTPDAGEGLSGIVLLAILAGLPTTLITLPLLGAALPFPFGQIVIGLAIIANWTMIGWLLDLMFDWRQRRKSS